MLSSNYKSCFCRKTKPNPPQSWHWRHNSDRGNATFWTQKIKPAVSSDSSFILRASFFSQIRLKFTKFVQFPIHFVIFYSFGLNSVPTERSCAFGRLSSWTWLRRKRMFAVCQRDGGFLLCMTSVYIEWAKITSIKCWHDSPLLVHVF